MFYCEGSQIRTRPCVPWVTSCVSLLWVWTFSGDFVLHNHYNSKGDITAHLNAESFWWWHCKCCISDTYTFTLFPTTWDFGPHQHVLRDNMAPNKSSEWSKPYHQHHTLTQSMKDFVNIFWDNLALNKSSQWTMPYHQHHALTQGVKNFVNIFRDNLTLNKSNQTLINMPYHQHQALSLTQGVKDFVCENLQRQLDT